MKFEDGNPKGFVAVGDVNDAHVGAITYWRLSGEVEIDRLRAEFASRGLDAGLLPEVPEDDTAARRAANAQARKHTLVRPLARRGAWAIVNEKITGNAARADADVDFQVGLKVYWKDEKLVFDPSSHPGIRKVREAFNRFRGVLVVEDISSWLTKLAARCAGVSVRETGGVYFIPRDRLAVWRTVAEALAAASAHRVYRVPAVHGEEAIEAILDALAAEAAREAELMEAELQTSADASDDDKLSARQLRTRAERCQQQLVKLATYEKLLGRKLPEVQERMENLNANIAAAALVATAA